MATQLESKSKSQAYPRPQGGEFTAYFCQRTAPTGPSDIRGLLWEIKELTKWQQVLFVVLGEAGGICREYAERLGGLGDELADETSRRVQRLAALLPDSGL